MLSHYRRWPQGALATVEIVGDSGKDAVAARQAKAKEFEQAVVTEKQKKKLAAGEAVALAAGVAAAATVEPVAALATGIVWTATDHLTRAAVKKRLEKERTEAEAALRAAEAAAAEAEAAAEAAAAAEQEETAKAAREQEQAERRAKQAEEREVLSSPDLL